MASSRDAPITPGALAGIESRPPFQLLLFSLHLVVVAKRGRIGRQLELLTVRTTWNLAVQEQ